MLITLASAAPTRCGRAAKKLAQVHRAGRFADRAERSIHLALFLMPGERVEALQAERTVVLALRNDDSNVALDGR